MLVTKVVCRSYCAHPVLAELGDVYACGGNSDGQLGLGGGGARLEPTLVECLTEPIGKVRHGIICDMRVLFLCRPLSCFPLVS